jgi:hypothetical protein
MSGKKRGKKEEKKDELPPPPPPEKKDDTPPPEPDTQQIIVLLEDYRLPEGVHLPEGLTDQQWREQLWLSDDCNAWALGKQFKDESLGPFWPVFYDAYVDITLGQDELLAVVPPGDWLHFQFYDQEKTEGIIEEPFKVAVAKALMDLHGGKYEECIARLPEASDFSSIDAYNQAWLDFANANKNFYALYYNLARTARDHMLVLYEQRFPEASQEWLEREWASEATDQGLNLEDATDWAYHHAYPACPEVIDPSNPEHEECQEAWLRLRSYIDEYTE